MRTMDHFPDLDFRTQAIPPNFRTNFGQTCPAEMKNAQKYNSNSILDWKSPTVTFTTLELRNPSHDVLELHKIRRSPDFEALKLWKGSSGVRHSPRRPCSGHRPWAAQAAAVASDQLMSRRVVDVYSVVENVFVASSMLAHNLGDHACCTSTNKTPNSLFLLLLLLLLPSGWRSGMHYMLLFISGGKSQSVFAPACFLYW